MSYASVTANNAPPPSQQPHADPALLNTTPLTAGNTFDDASRVRIISSSNKLHTETSTRKANVGFSGDDDDNDDALPTPKKKKENKRLQEVEAEGLYLWKVTKHYLLRPGVAGGLVGLVNLGLLAGAGRAFYAQPHLRGNRAVLSSTILTAIALISVEGYAAEKYRNTPRGQAEEARAKRDGTLVYKHLHEQVLRPGVLGGLIGLLNAAVLGTIGYFSYINWDKPSWDRRAVSAAAFGILTLWGGEGLLAERYRRDE